jgi:hypothetical protein
MTRMTKKRTLQKAGFVHIAGWVTQDDAPAIQAKIDAAAPEVQKVSQNDNG